MNESYLILFFFLFFIFCFYLGLIQLVLLPHIFPSLHAGNGIMKGANDSLYFHGLALELFEKMKIHGWNAWSINYQGQSPAGISAFFYYLFVPKPFILIPFTSFSHSLSGVFLLKIMRLLFKDVRIIFFVIFPFLFMPSAITWLSNFHRDSYFILGFLLVIYAHTILLLDPLSFRRVIGSALYFVFGTFLIWLARPYALDIIIFLSATTFFFFIYRKPNRLLIISSITILVIVGFFSVVYLQENKTDGSDQLTKGFASSISIMIKNKFRGFAQNRYTFTKLIDAKSNLDTGIQFNTFSDVISYIPRAMQISFFAPFPNTWFEKDLNLFKKVAVLEMIFLYLMYFYFLLMCLNRKLTMLAIPALIFSTGLILFQGLIVCNVGTLYRMRYGSIMIFVTIALSYFFSESFFLRKKALKN